MDNATATGQVLQDDDNTGATNGSKLWIIWTAIATPLFFACVYCHCRANTPTDRLQPKDEEDVEETAVASSTQDSNEIGAAAAFRREIPHWMSPEDTWSRAKFFFPALNSLYRN